MIQGFEWPDEGIEEDVEESPEEIVKIGGNVFRTVHNDGVETCTVRKDLQRFLHREDAPAMTYPDGSEEWWLFGKRHREEGPAVWYPRGYKGHRAVSIVGSENGQEPKDGRVRPEVMLWFENGKQIPPKGK